MNVFEISTRPPNSYLFSSTSNSHLNGSSSTASPQFDLNYPNNHHQSFNNSSCQNHAPNHCQYHQTNHNSHNFYQHHPTCQHHPQYSQYSNYAAPSSSTPNHHQSRRTAATNISFNSGHLARNESPHVTAAATSFNLKQRSSSTNSQMPSNNTRNNNLVTTAHIRYNGNTNQYNGGNVADVVTNNNNNGVSLKSFGGPSGGSSRVLPVTTATSSNSSSSNAGNCSTPSSPHLSSWTNGSRPVTNLNRSMSGKFVARVIATNNTTPPSTTSSASTQTTSQVPSNCLYHRVESPSPRAAARVHSNYSNLPQSYPNHNHNQRSMAHNNDYLTSSAVPIQTTNSTTLNETNSGGNSTLATATVLPVYYEKDSVVTSSAQLPVLKIPQLSRASSTLISNSANSGVGSATAVITVNNPHSAAAAHNAAASLSSHPTMSSSSFFDHKNNNISNGNLKSTLQQPFALTNNSVPTANRFNRGSSSNSSTTSYQRSNGAPAAGVSFYSDDINTNNNKISNKSYSVIKGIKVNDPSATISQPQQSQSVPKTSILNNGSFRLSKQQQENSNNKDINNSNNNSNQPVDSTSNNNATAPQSASKKFTSSFNQFLNSNRLMSQLMQKSSSSASSSSSSSSSSSNDQQQNGNNNNTSGSQQPAQKSILVNRKKFAYPTQTGVGNMTMIGSGADGSSSPPPPYAPPKKTVTFAN